MEFKSNQHVVPKYKYLYANLVWREKGKVLRKTRLDQTLKKKSTSWNKTATTKYLYFFPSPPLITFEYSVNF